MVRARTLPALASSTRPRVRAVVGLGPSRRTIFFCGRIPPRWSNSSGKALQNFPFRELSENPNLFYALTEGVDAFAGVAGELKSPSSHYLADVTRPAAHRAVYFVDRPRHRPSSYIALYLSQSVLVAGSVIHPLPIIFFFIG